MTPTRRSLVILGATGSVGGTLLQLVSDQPDLHSVLGLAANRQVAAMRKLCHRHHPRYAALADRAAARQLRRELRRDGLTIEVLEGSEGLQQLAAHDDADTVLAAIVGLAGLESTLAAARAGKRILLANKETLVAAGELFMQAVAQGKAELLPVDSEHNAILQCLPPDSHGGELAASVRRLLLTASGGPTLRLPMDALAQVGPKFACTHPNWSMGRKVSVDSATMMNKGLELIEACWLFNMPEHQVEVVVHPQSIVHSMVEYIDGSVLAQLACPDMRVPLAAALNWPHRQASGAAFLDLTTVGSLDFEPPSLERFPCLALARAVARDSGGGAAALNAANEVAVAAFLNGDIAFTHIASVAEAGLGAATREAPESIPALLELDRRARALAQRAVASHTAHAVAV